MSRLDATDQTGIEIIDGQHEKILEQLELTREAILAGDKERCGRAVDETFSLITSHFGFEEKLMEQVNYPFVRAHKRLHDYFLQRLASYSQRIESDADTGPEVATEMVEFASRWLNNHFIHEDRDYSPQLLVEMQGLVSDGDRGSWLSRTLRHFSYGA